MVYSEQIPLPIAPSSNMTKASFRPAQTCQSYDPSRTKYLPITLWENVATDRRQPMKTLGSNAPLVEEYLPIAIPHRMTHATSIPTKPFERGTLFQTHHLPSTLSQNMSISRPISFDLGVTRGAEMVKNDGGHQIIRIFKIIECDVTVEREADDNELKEKGGKMFPNSATSN